MARALNFGRKREAKTFPRRYTFAMSARDALSAIGEYAEDQHGMITHAQAAKLGIHRSMLMRLATSGALAYQGFMPNG